MAYPVFEACTVEESIYNNAYQYIEAVKEELSCKGILCKNQLYKVFRQEVSSESYRYMQKDIYVLVSVRITGATSITDNVSKISPAEKAVLNILETWNTQYKFSYVVNGRLYQSTGKLLATKNQTLIAAINILRHKLPNAVILPDSKNTPQKAPTTQPKQQPKPLRKAQ